MEKLIEGIHKFQQDKLGHYKALFRRLSREGQTPHTLFITCCDSRVHAELITQSQPGDLFVVKNIGNIVPPATFSHANSTAAAIEFAIEALGVSDVVVCGHSQCGAMAAVIENPPSLKDQPHLKSWLDLISPVRDVIELNYNELQQADKITVASEENVLFALENLQTYPCVASRLKAGTLRLHGWFFKIATGEVFAYSGDLEQFVPIEKLEDPS